MTFVLTMYSVVSLLPPELPWVQLLLQVLPSPLRLLLKMQHLRSLLHRNRQVRVVQTTYLSKVKREFFTRVHYLYLNSRIIPTNGAAVAVVIHYFCPTMFF